MTLDEIHRHLSVGQDRSVCVDISLTPELPHYVRIVSIRRGNSVWVRFRSYGYDEGGLLFRGQFETEEDMIESLEAYLGKPLSQWENFTTSGNYPDPPVGAKPEMTWDEIVDTARRILPRRGNFQP